MRRVGRPQNRIKARRGTAPTDAESAPTATDRGRSPTVFVRIALVARAAADADPADIESAVRQLGDSIAATDLYLDLAVQEEQGAVETVVAYAAVGAEG